jgi:predicted nucleic acid-binding protein
MTSCVVIDAGFAFKLLLPNPARDQLKQLLRQWSSQGIELYAPSLWLYELTSILTKTVHFGEIDERDARDSLSLAVELGIRLIEPEAELARQAFAWTLHLHRAASYDSFYVALAEKMSCDLWTVDQRLVNSVSQSWVRLAPQH